MFRSRPWTITLMLALAVTQTQAQTEPEMVVLPATCIDVGTLLMDQQANALRNVCVDAFAISRYEVTFREYDQFTEATGRAARHDVGFGRDNRPVIDVSWFDAVAYAEWLSEQTGKTYRLPTDAEWEYAASANAGVGYRFSWDPEPHYNKANCRNCGSQWSGHMTAPVGSFEPNALGLHDMHGNVWEWTSDCYREINPEQSNRRSCSGVVRGGSWDVLTDHLVLWLRAPHVRERPAQDVGFRLALEL